MTEELFVLGVGVLVIGFLAFFTLRPRKPDPYFEQLIKDMRPSQTLAEAVLSSGDTIELRAQSAQGLHKVWLECDVAGVEGRWSATARLSHHVSSSGSGYRKTAQEAAATEEAPLTIRDDGENVSLVGTVLIPRTGAFHVPSPEGRLWLQLMTLPSCPEGSDLFVRVGLSDLTPTLRASFRAFIGTSVT